MINSGTCYRAPERTLPRVARRLRAAAGFSCEGLAPYYERVEDDARRRAGERRCTSAAIARHDRARRRRTSATSTAPCSAQRADCDGQGVCCFGCPTGAKRSTDVSYVPEALKRGAQLVTAAACCDVDIVDGRARGVTARLGLGARSEAHRPRRGGDRRRRHADDPAPAPAQRRLQDEPDARQEPLDPPRVEGARALRRDASTVRSGIPQATPSTSSPTKG